jgi:prepilin-type N-terminal cleavage/methylation domain-containing protein
MYRNIIRAEGAGVRLMDQQYSNIKGKPASRRGFTLLECSLAMVIIGVGVLALIEAQAHFMTVNLYSSQAATGTYLANEIRERMRNLPKHDPVSGLIAGSAPTGWGRETGEVIIDDLDDVDDFDDVTFRPGGTLPGPIDSAGRVINNMLASGVIEIDASNNPVPLRGWEQAVEVVKVEPLNYGQTRGDYYVNLAGNPPLNVDEFALRVTVTVRYTPPGETVGQEMARVSWIVP